MNVTATYNYRPMPSAWIRDFADMTDDQLRRTANNDGYILGYREQAAAVLAYRTGGKS